MRRLGSALVVALGLAFVLTSAVGVLDFNTRTIDREPVKAITGLRVVDKSDSELTLGWDSFQGAASYQVYYGKGPQTNAECNSKCLTYWSEKNSLERAKLTGLKASAEYPIRVAAMNVFGIEISSTRGSGITAKTEAPPPPRIVAASFNIKCFNCLPAKPAANEKSWNERRNAVAERILSREPDVIGIQEASQAWLPGRGSTSQFDDLLGLLNSGGKSYSITNSYKNNCVKHWTPTRCSYRDRGASKGTRIFFRKDKLALIKQGSKKLEQTSKQERYLAWAIFEDKKSKYQFVFATTHLEPGKSHHNLRRRQATQVANELDRINDANLPVVFTGDLNSTRNAKPSNAPYDVLTASGLTDPLGQSNKSARVSRTATAESRVNANFDSFGGFKRNQTRHKTSENGSNLDYILTTPMRVLRWETVVTLGQRGEIVGLIPSDHNMLLAEVVLPKKE